MYVYDDILVYDRICFTVKFPVTIHILEDMGTNTPVITEEPCKLCHHFPRSPFGLVITQASKIRPSIF